MEERPQETDDEGIERDSSIADIDEFLSQKSDIYKEKSIYSLKNVMQVSAISKSLFFILYKTSKKKNLKLI